MIGKQTEEKIEKNGIIIETIKGKNWKKLAKGWKTEIKAEMIEDQLAAKIKI